MTMIEDMGGRVLPNQTFGPEDQAIFNTAMTSSGQEYNQQLNTTLPGSKNASEMARRINDPEAQLQAMGFQAHVDA